MHRLGFVFIDGGQIVLLTDVLLDVVQFQRAAIVEFDQLPIAITHDTARGAALVAPVRVVEEQRAAVMAALECVGMVVIFEEESPLPLIEQLQPTIYAKGGDYTIDTINQEERKVVEGYGGRIEILPGVEGSSTTSIVTRIEGDG